MHKTLSCISLIIGIVLVTILVYTWYTDHCAKAASQKSGFVPSSWIPPIIRKKLDEATLQKEFVDYGKDQTDFFETTQYDPANDELNQSIHAQHQQYVDETYKGSVGPDRMNAVLDGISDVVPRIGLRRVDYSNIHVSGDALSVPSQYVDQVDSPLSSSYKFY